MLSRAPVLFYIARTRRFVPSGGGTGQDGGYLIIAKRLHPDNADVSFNQHRQQLLLKAVVMGVEDVKRQLYGVPFEILREHLKMDIRVLAAGKP